MIADDLRKMADRTIGAAEDAARIGELHVHAQHLQTSAMLMAAAALMEKLTTRRIVAEESAREVVSALEQLPAPVLDHVIGLKHQRDELRREIEKRDREIARIREALERADSHLSVCVTNLGAELPAELAELPKAIDQLDRALAEIGEREGGER